MYLTESTLRISGIAMFTGNSALGTGGGAVEFVSGFFFTIEAMFGCPEHSTSNAGKSCT